MEPKRIILFSSSYHVEEIRKFLNSLGQHPQATIDLIALPTEEYKDVSKYDYVGFASGLWKWDYSRQVYDHLYKIYGLKGKLCFSFAITGNPFERRGYYLKDPIEKQGGIFLGGLVGKGNIYGFMDNGTEEPDPDFIQQGKTFLAGVFNMDYRAFLNNPQLPNPMNPPSRQQSYYGMRTMGPNMGMTMTNNAQMGGNFDPNMNNNNMNGQNFNPNMNNNNMNGQGNFDPNNPNNNMGNNGPYQQTMQMGGTMNNPQGMGNQYGQPGNNDQYGQSGMNNQYGQPGMGNQYGQTGMSGQYGQTGMGSQYGQPGMGNQFGQQGMNNQYGQPGMNNQYGQPGMNNQYGQTGMNGQYGQPGMGNQYNMGGQYGQQGYYGNNYYGQGRGYGRDRFRELDPDVRLEAPPGWYDKEHLRLQAAKEREKYFYNGEKDITEYQDKYISYAEQKKNNPY
jgi:hypothetical protein